MYKYVIMGIQGCGKGTQAKLLAKDYDLVHISVGDIFRWHIQSHTKLAARIGRITAAGNLVPDDIVEEIIRGRLDQHDWNFGFILDGFPRNCPPGGILFGKLRHRRGDSDRRGGPGGPRPRAESAALWQVWAGLQPDLSSSGRIRMSAMSAAGSLSTRADDTPEAVPQAAARLPRQDGPDPGAFQHQGAGRFGRRHATGRGSAERNSPQARLGVSAKGEAARSPP